MTVGHFIQNVVNNIVIRSEEEMQPHDAFLLLLSALRSRIISRDIRRVLSRGFSRVTSRALGRVLNRSYRMFVYSYFQQMML